MAYRGVPRPAGETSSRPWYFHAALPTGVPPAVPTAIVSPQASWRVAELTVDWSAESEPAAEPRGSGGKKLYVEPEAAASRPPVASTAESRSAAARPCAAVAMRTASEVAPAYEYASVTGVEGDAPTVRLAIRPRASYAYEASSAVPAASIEASLLPRS